MSNPRFLRLIACLSSYFILGMGLFVIIGWLTQTPQMILLNKNFAPMLFNTALCFVLISLSMLLLLSNRAILLVQAIATLIIFFSILVLLEYIFNLNFGIDELFIKSFIPGNENHPGRIAPNSAVAFIFTGLSILTLTKKDLGSFKTVLCIIANLMILMIGIIGCIGYVSKMIILYGAGQLIRMAFHTALCFIALATGLMAMTYLRKKPTVFDPFIPLLVSFTILLITFLGWQAIRKNQDDYLENLVKIKLEAVRDLIQIYMHERASAFERMTYRWVNRAGTPEEEWRADATNYVREQSGYVAIEWVDNQYIIRWAEPESPNEQAIGFNLIHEANRRMAIEKAIKTKSIQMTTMLDLIQGGRGVLLVSPIFDDKGFGGLMVGVINTQQMFEKIINPKMTESFGIALYDRDVVVFHDPYQSKALYNDWNQSLMIPLLGQEWKLVVWPSKDLLPSVMSSWLPLLTILVGFFVACLAGFLLSVFQLLKIKSKMLDETQKHLIKANGYLNGILEGSTDLIVALDLSMNFIAFNTMYKTEIYRIFKIDLVLGMNFSCIAERLNAENYKKVMELWKKAMEGRAFTVVESFTDPRYDSLDYEIHYSPIYNAQGQLIGASHIATNISMQMQNSKKMAESKQKLEGLVQNLESQNKELGLLRDLMSLLQSSFSFQAMLEPISTYAKKILPNTSGVIYLINPDNDQLLNKATFWGEPLASPEAMPKLECWALLRGQMHKIGLQDDGVRCQHVTHSSEQPDAYACIPLFAQGQILGLFYIEMSREESENVRLINMAQILSEQIALSFYNIKLQDELRMQSTHDSLTGLFNRRFFEEYVQKELFKGQRAAVKFSLLLIDIDHFKKINDSYGHLVGDRVLQAIANELGKNCRKSDLICRWGGEEFLMFLRESSLNGIKKRAESLRKVISSLVINYEAIQITGMTLSIGVASYPEQGLQLDSLIAMADEALYKAKNQGRNKIVISDLTDKPSI